MPAHWLLLVATFIALGSPQSTSNAEHKSPASCHYQATRGLSSVVDEQQVEVCDWQVPPVGLHLWLWSIGGACAVGLSGILPLLMVTAEGHGGLLLSGQPGLLSFAVGGLLGDVFLHLLPEAWNNHLACHQSCVNVGLWVIAGLIIFFILEKAFPDQQPQQKRQRKSKRHAGITKSTPTGDLCSPVQKYTSKHNLGAEVRTACTMSNGLSWSGSSGPIKMSGYLNLLANSIDNFTHGLAVAGSFSVSFKVGFLTTFAILLHEIPHEFGDFSILLRAGFDRWQAAWLQAVTAGSGVAGALFLLVCHSPSHAGNNIAWTLPFTAGSFLYIALVNVLPDLLTNNQPRSVVLQISFLLGGVTVIAVISLLVD
uniref:zinc transporter ZIP13 n=1 Tax=Myxine glutinosa TaxID=7769 RepID=UPI0035901761